MGIILPTERSVVKNHNPKLMIIFGLPKSGKSSLMASLDDNLIIDLEDGYRALSVMAVQARTANDLREISKAIATKMQELGKYPYRFITIDNATRLEEMAMIVACALYRATPMGAMWGAMKDANGNPIKDKNGKVVYDPKSDIRTLPNGSGYLFLRKATKQLIDMFKPLTEHLILVAHVKDKQIQMNGAEMSQLSVDLAGKLGDIICGEADAIALCSREKNKTYLDFNGGDNNIRGARPLHLRNKKICVAESDEDGNLKIDMSQIYLNE